MNVHGDAAVVSAAHGVRVVVVDDHAGVRQGLISLLSSDPDITVVGATDGQGVVDVVDRQHPDVVLMDLHMPVVDGVAATRALRGGGSSAQVLVLTGRAEPERLQAALQAGAVGYLTKDADPMQILAGIHAAAAGQGPPGGGCLRASGR